MQLSFLNFKKNKKKERDFFALFLKEDEGIVMLLEEDGVKLRISAKERFSFSDGWESIVEDVDQALYKIETNTKKSPDNLIIFTYSHLIDQTTHEIKKPYLAKIKVLVQGLELKPLGFIEALEAASSYLEEKEESPLTAILIELDKKALTAAVIKGGTQVFQQSVSRTNNLVEDLSLILNQKKEKTLLPSRIILYNSKDLDEESTKILTHHWSEELFIQLPKVEIIEEDELVHGLINLFAEQIASDSNKESEEPAQETEEVLGFTIGQEVKRDNDSVISEKHSTLINTPSKMSLPKFSFKFLEKIPNLFSHIKLPFRVSYALGTFGVFLIISSLFLLEFYFHKATLIIYLPSQSIHKEIELNEDILGPVVKLADDTFDIKDSLVTTGHQTVGEKARGEVSLFSFSDKETHLDKGTVLSADGLKFLLDSDVDIASASEVLSDNTPIKKPGEVSSKVTAENIGPEGNIGKNKRFQIADFSSSNYFAINNAVFSGGSKKELTTVSKKDIEDLRKKALDKAKLFDQKTSAEETTGKQKILSDLTEVTLEQERFSKEVGEEASKIDLDAQVKRTFYVYDESKLQEEISAKVKNEVKAGYELDGINLKYDFKNVEKEKDNVKLVIELDSKALKETSRRSVISAILFKSKSSLDKILKEKFGVDGYRIDIVNPLPFLRNLVPPFKKNIKLEISYL